MICQSLTKPWTDDLIHDKLRRLLWLSPEARGRVRAVGSKFVILRVSSIGAGGLFGALAFSMSPITCSQQNDPNFAEFF